MSIVWRLFGQEGGELVGSEVEDVADCGAVEALGFHAAGKLRIPDAVVGGAFACFCEQGVDGPAQEPQQSPAVFFGVEIQAAEGGFAVPLKYFR